MVGASARNNSLVAGVTRAVLVAGLTVGLVGMALALLLAMPTLDVAPRFAQPCCRSNCWRRFEAYVCRCKVTMSWVNWLSLLIRWPAAWKPKKSCGAI